MNCPVLQHHGTEQMELRWCPLAQGSLLGFSAGVCTWKSPSHLGLNIQKSLSSGYFQVALSFRLEPKYQRRKIACVGGSLEENIWVTSATQQNRWFNVFRTYHFFVQLSALQTECFCDFFFFF